MRKPYRTARPNPRLLEPRMVFDAAAAAVVTELATDTAHVVDLTRTIDATESLLTQQSEMLPTTAMPVQIAFVDASLLTDGALPGLHAGVELVALQPDADGITQISAALAGRSDVSAIYLVTHGGPGRVSLGSTELDNSTLAANAARIAQWAPHLSAGADILLYGCQVGGADGLALLQSLANLTGADVAASTNNTGPAALGGDWVLEQSTGTIEAQGFATPDGLARLDALLSVNVSSNSLTGWVAVTAANNQNDATNDQQTGSGSVSQDIVGNTTYRSAYVKYDDGGTANDLSDDWLAFRVRVNNQDNNNPATPRFNSFAFFGVDADGNNTVDFFAGVYNPAGNNGRIGVYDANGAGNTGPSDTGINGTPTFKYDSATTGYAGLYSMLATGDGSNFSGDIDYFVSYQIRIADLNANKAVFGLTADITQNTVLRYIVGTAAQDNAFNQDISGITGAYMSSTLTWAQLGGFTSPIQTNGAVVTSASADTATADERGGTANGSGGSTPTGNLMTNDAGSGITVTRVQAGATVGASAGTVTAGSTSALNAATVQGTYGTLTVGADGSYSYAVDNANGTVQALRTSSNTLTDTFSYRITDGSAGTADSTLTVTICGANDAPVITSSSTGTVAENAAISTVIYTGTATDVDAGDTKTWSLKSGVGDESLLAIDATTGAVTLRAPANFESKNSYSFTVVVTDAGGLVSERAVTVAVTNVNEAPLAVADTGTANERGGTANGTAGTDASGNVLTNDTDPDAGDTRSVTAFGLGGTSGTVGQALAGSFGSLTLNADGSYSYVLDNANSSVQALRTSSNTLTETFNYTMIDGGGLSSSSTLTITIRGANDAPVITSGSSGSVGENAAIATVIYTGTATDVDAGDTKTWSLKSGVGDESLLAINATTGAVTLRAAANFESKASYSFTIVVTDTGGLTSERAVTVAVIDVNEAPTAVPDTGIANERGGTANGTAGTDASGNVLANDSDPDAGDTLSVTAIRLGSTTGTVGQPLQGTYGALTLNADGSFSYVIDDTHGAVQSLNGGDTLTETFTYTMTDAGGLSSSSTITITIHGANDAPVASVVPAVTVAEGVPMSPIVVPAFTDVDNFVVVHSATLPDGSPLPGWLGFNSLTRTLTGTPPTGNPGTITIRVTGTDGSLSDSVDISLVVSAPQAPQAADDAASATEAGGVANGTPGSDGSGNLLGNDSGLQIAVSRIQPGNSLGASATALGSNGAVITGSHGQLTVQADGSYSYVLSQTDAAVQALNVGQSLTDVFSYEVTDSTGQTSVALLTVTIGGANDAPVAVALPAVSLTAGSPITPVVLPSFTDVDDTVLTYSAALPDGSPLPGWLSFDPATRTFTGTPPAGSPGTITIRITGTDGSLGAHANLQLVIGDPPLVQVPVLPPAIVPIAPPPSGMVAIAPPVEPAPRAPEPLPITRSTTTVPPVNEVLAPARPAFELTGSPLATPYELARLQPVPEAAPMGDLYTDSRGFRVLVMPSNVQELSVFRGISDQFVERGSNVKFNLPQDAFVHSRPDQTVRLSARQADGRPLPSWLQFDAENGSFSGTPPQDVEGEVRISILARDGAGNEAAALFRLNVEEERAGDARSESFSTRLRDALPFSPPAAPLPELPPDEAATATPAEAGQAR